MDLQKHDSRYTYNQRVTSCHATFKIRHSNLPFNISYLELELFCHTFTVHIGYQFYDLKSYANEPLEIKNWFYSIS